MGKSFTKMMKEKDSRKIEILEIQQSQFFTQEKLFQSCILGIIDVSIKGKATWSLAQKPKVHPFVMFNYQDFPK